MMAVPKWLLGTAPGSVSNAHLRLAASAALVGTESFTLNPNRGILLTPFHNMALMGPDTSRADVDRHTEIFRDVVGALFD